MNVNELQAYIQNRITVPGVTIDLDGQWSCGFFPKMKNYALLTNDGEIETKGGLFHSRAELPFFKLMIDELTKEILLNDLPDVENIIKRYRAELEYVDLDPASFVKRVRPTKSLAKYIENRKALQPYFEALLSAGISEHPQGSPVAFYRALIDGAPQWTLYDKSGDNRPVDRKHYIKSFKKKIELFTNTIDDDGNHTPSWIELACNITRKNEHGVHVTRNLWIADVDDEALIEFAEERDWLDIHRSVYAVVADNSPCKSNDRDDGHEKYKGDLIIEFEGERADLTIMRLAAVGAHSMRELLIQQYNVNPAHIKILINGARSFYLFISDPQLTGPDDRLPEIHAGIVERLARDIIPEQSILIDFGLYKYNHLIRLPGSIHPCGGWFRTISVDELKTMIGISDDKFIAIYDELSSEPEEEL